MSRNLSTIRKTILQLPLSETLNYLVYKIQLAAGIYQLRTPIQREQQIAEMLAVSPAWFDFWSEGHFPIDKIKHADEIIQRADKILSGQIMLFSFVPDTLDLDPGQPLQHWSKKAAGKRQQECKDIKFTWEPARFSWAIHLSQAYLLTKNEKYTTFFWEKFEAFNQANPVNMGPNWESAQEVGLRLIALVISAHLMKQSRTFTEDHIQTLSVSIAEHAKRILPTICYAKSQNNNHMLSEAAGLYTAGTFLNAHPDAERWRTTGKKLFTAYIKKQIDENGEYVQHSSNYHRMMLTLAVWMKKLLDANNEPLNDEAAKKLQKATQWLYEMSDKISGHVPNLGHNDGSLILPFSTCAYADHRPVIQAASISFLNSPLYSTETHDAIIQWMQIKPDKKDGVIIHPTIEIPRIGNDTSWAVLRANRYRSRPAHADQLHVDLWYQGVNVLIDAGTYSYNAPAPWNNQLACTKVHNTLTISGFDQMTRASQFLWLDWSQAHASFQSSNRITAAHDGYLPFGLVHERQLMRLSGTHWQIIDKLHKLKAAKKEMNLRVHWLLPDWVFKTEGLTTTFSAPFGKVKFSHQFKSKISSASLSFYKEGKALSPAAAEEDDILLGWYSPSYGIKVPAVSMVLSATKKIPDEITTEVIFE